MEILSNFISIHCFITFVIGAVFMFIAVCIVTMGEDEEPRNNVRFFVKKTNSHPPKLFVVYRNHKSALICYYDRFHLFGLNQKDFTDMKEGEVREVFLNLKD